MGLSILPASKRERAGGIDSHAFGRFGQRLSLPFAGGFELGPQAQNCGEAVLIEGAGRTRH